MLESDVYAAEVRAEEQRVQALGSNEVPFFVLDEKYAVSGAQPVEIFLTVLERAWAESHPVVKLVGAGQDAGVCDDESCAV